MVITVKNEAPFQILTGAFTIGPSPTGYELQVGATPQSFTTLFSVGANTPRMVTNVANGSYFRLKNNVGDVEVNWQRTCAGGGGGGGADYTPGEYIDIQNNVISVTGITPDEYLTTADTQDFATKEFVTGATSPIQTQLDDVERVTATALTELHQDILNLSGSTSEFVTSGDVATQITAATANLMTSSATQTMINAATSGITEELTDLEDMMETKEEVIAAALVDLNDNKVGSTTVRTIVTLTQAEYDALTVKDPTTLYIIKNN